MAQMSINELVAYIFSNTRLPLAVLFAGWAKESPRFRVFAEMYRDKIRKKVRGVAEREGFGDLQAELEAAYFLVGERRFVVEYERYGTGKQRGPDLSVLFKTHIRFDVEVTRLRGGSGEQAGGGASEQSKLINSLCAKSKQLQPGIMNVLVMVSDFAEIGEEEIVAALRALQERVEAKDDDFFVRRGYAGSRDFLRMFGRLSAIRLVRVGAPAVLKVMPGARQPLLGEIATVLRR